MRDNVVLIGMMGCGKSTVGKLLAEALGFAFVDTDQYIEKALGRTIPDIFAKEGEAFFRDQELGAAEELALRKGQVIACGGGLPTRADSIASLKYSGTVISSGGTRGRSTTTCPWAAALWASRGERPSWSGTPDGSPSIWSGPTMWWRYRPPRRRPSSGFWRC